MNRLSHWKLVIIFFPARYKEGKLQWCAFALLKMNFFLMDYSPTHPGHSVFDNSEIYT